MAAFGGNLQREREMRGVTLEEISAATKISFRFLRAIEEENFAGLPGGVFTRSFIRTYARYLGLDEERVMAEFHLTGQPGADADMHRRPPLKLPSQRSGSHTTLLVLLVAGIMLSAAYLLFRYSRRSPEVQGHPPSPSQQVSSATPSAGAPATSPGPGAGQAGTPATATPGAPSNPTGTPATSTAAAGPAGAPNAPGAPSSNANPAAASGTPVAGSGTVASQPVSGETAPPANPPAGKNSGLVLQVAATESTWVGIEADGQTVLQRVLKTNEVRTLKARESFDVTTGNAQGVILTLNGETLKPLGRRGEVKSVHLTHDDLKNAAP
jgi:cytoskeleton protein RodZ